MSVMRRTNTAVMCCGKPSTVTDSRFTEVGKRRRRKCVKCGRRWTSHEVTGLLSRRMIESALKAIDQTYAQLGIIERDLKAALEHAVDVDEDEDSDAAVDGR